MRKAATAKTRTSSAGSEFPRRGGYTLVELLVVLLIMSAVLALVPPLFDRGLSSTELRSVAREMMAAMRDARSTAVSTRSPVAFTLDLEQRHYQVDERRRVALPETLRLELLTGQSELRGRGAGAITFYSDGSASGGEVTLLAEARRIRLDVDWMSGRVSWHE
jgi:general secretion pathway protein H